MGDCLPCPEHSTTQELAATGLADCLCDEGWFLTTAADGSALCSACPQPGTNCSEPGVTITTLELAPGYWRSENTSVAVLSCPDEHRGEDSACGGGVAACREGSGVSGVFCTLCPEDMYKQYETSSCVSCDDVTYSLAVPLLLALVLLIENSRC